jgi:hypothetical protein
VGYYEKTPLLEFLNKGAHYSSLSGEKLSEHQVVAAVEASQRELGVHLKSYLLLPVWSEPPHYALLAEQDDLATPASDQLAEVVDHELSRQNGEYDNRRRTLRLGPVRLVALREGSWAEFQKNRLARSGGTVEQYKQPHLVPDLELISSFRQLEPVH